MGEDNPEIEYALQYFGFTPFMFYQDYTELLSEELSSIMKKVIMEKQSVKFRDRYSSAFHNVEDSMKDMPEILSEVFYIPKNVLLDSDKVHEKQYSDEEIRVLEQQVKNLEQQINNDIRTYMDNKKKAGMFKKLCPTITKMSKAHEVIDHLNQTVTEAKKYMLFEQQFLKELDEITDVDKIMKQS